jgi:hypothetical protein
MLKRPASSIINIGGRKTFCLFPPQEARAGRLDDGQVFPFVRPISVQSTVVMDRDRQDHFVESFSLALAPLPPLPPLRAAVAFASARARV